MRRKRSSSSGWERSTPVTSAPMFGESGRMSTASSFELATRGRFRYDQAAPAGQVSTDQEDASRADAKLSHPSPDAEHMQNADSHCSPFFRRSVAHRDVARTDIPAGSVRPDKAEKRDRRCDRGPSAAFGVRRKRQDRGL